MKNGRKKSRKTERKELSFSNKKESRRNILNILLKIQRLNPEVPPLPGAPGDPMDALLRDGTVLRFPASTATDDAASKMNQEQCLQKLENLVLAQKRQQMRMRELLTGSENRNAQVSRHDFNSDIENDRIDGMRGEYNYNNNNKSV